MKKIAGILFIIAGFVYLFSACTKNEIPRKKNCQLIAFNDNRTGIGFNYDYEYNAKRELQKISMSSTIPLIAFGLDYNNQGQPVSLTDVFDHPGASYNLVWQNDRLARLDAAGNPGQPLFYYTYDHLGRLIERRDANSNELVIRYEYEGSSFNFKRKIYDESAFPNPQHLIKFVFEYKYDNKVNPLTTISRFHLLPFYAALDEGGQQQYFYPVPDNNWTSQSLIEVFENDSIVLAQNYYYNYKYNDAYPVTQHLRFVQHVAGQPDQVSESNSFYSYDCLEDRGKQ